MFERFTRPARDAVTRAQSEALAGGHGTVGQVHLLLAVLDGGTVPAALRDRGVDAAYVRERLTPPAEPARKRWFGRIPFSQRAKRTLELALREAVAERHRFIAAEHLLLAVRRDSGGPAWGVLAAAGVDPEELRAELIAALEDRRAA